MARANRIEEVIAELEGWESPARARQEEIDKLKRQQILEKYSEETIIKAQESVWPDEAYDEELLRDMRTLQTHLENNKVDFGNVDMGNLYEK